MLGFQKFKKRFLRRYGPWALVAGGSEGIGAAFAEELAGMGFHLVLVSHEEEPLNSFAAQLAGRHGVEVNPVVFDLSREDVEQGLAKATEGKNVGLVIYNAALSLIGRFLDTPLPRHLEALAVNCRGPLVAAHVFGERLKARGGGGLVLLSSMAGMQGSPMVAGYAATKAFNRVLAEGLWYEFKQSGVDVLAALPGPTRTPGYLSSKPKKTGLFKAPEMKPEAVAEGALKALGRRPSHVCGLPNQLVTTVTGRFLPRSWAIRLFGSQTTKMYEG